MILRVIVPAILWMLLLIWAAAFFARTHCPAYSHRVTVDGQSYCFDNGHYNVDGE